MPQTRDFRCFGASLTKKGALFFGFDLNIRQVEGVCGFFGKFIGEDLFSVNLFDVGKWAFFNIFGDVPLLNLNSFYTQE